MHNQGLFAQAIIAAALHSGAKMQAGVSLLEEAPKLNTTVSAVACFAANLLFENNT